MLLLVLILVLLAFGLLVVALLSGSVLWAWVSVGVSVVAAVVLLIDWLQRRSAVKAGAADGYPAGRSSGSGSMPMSVQGGPPSRGALTTGDHDPVTEVLPIISTSGSAGPGSGPDGPAGALAHDAGPRPEHAVDVQQTVVLPSIQPSGSAAPPSGARGPITPSGGFSSQSVTKSPVDRSAPDGPSGPGPVDPTSDDHHDTVAPAEAATSVVALDKRPGSNNHRHPDSAGADGPVPGAGQSDPTPAEAPTSVVGRANGSVPADTSGDRTAADADAAERTAVVDGRGAGAASTADDRTAGSPDVDAETTVEVGAYPGATPAGTRSTDTPTTDTTAAGTAAGDPDGADSTAGPAVATGADGARGVNGATGAAVGGAAVAAGVDLFGSWPGHSAQPANGRAADGHAPDGHAPDGHAPDGHTPDGYAAAEHVADGHAGDAFAADGHAPAGGSGVDDDVANIPEEPLDPIAAGIIGGLTDEIVVIDELPRYHVKDCRALVGREVIPLPVQEAVELGFTPCGWCTPDRALAARHRTSAR